MKISLVLYDTKDLVLIIFGTVVMSFVFFFLSPYLFEMHIELFIGKVIDSQSYGFSSSHVWM